MLSSFTDTHDFKDVWPALLYDAMHSRWEETNARTGVKVRVLHGGVSFRLDLKDGMLPMQQARRSHPKTAAAEVAWFLTGQKDSAWIRKHCKIWDKFVEDDGVTVDSAYGYRWRNHFGRDQLRQAVTALWSNPTDRRVYLSAWDPSTDGLGAAGQKNVPCPVGFNLMVEERYLHSSIYLRSSDLFVGLPYDVMGHAMLMRTVADTLKEHPLWQDLQLGTMHVTMAHAHVYEKHYEMARRCYAEPYAGDVAIEMPSAPMHAVETDPDGYVAAYAQLSEGQKWAEFNPRPEVVQ